MNERINGLWWKARIGYNEQNCDPEVLAKFAELIVRECADFIDSKFDISPYSGEVNSWADGSELKKHFGVEE